MGLVVIVDVERGTNAHSCVNFQRGELFTLLQLWYFFISMGKKKKEKLKLKYICFSIF